MKSWSNSIRPLCLGLQYDMNLFWGIFSNIKDALDIMIYIYMIYMLDMWRNIAKDMVSLGFLENSATGEGK